MKTLLTIDQQIEFIAKNHNISNIQHRWSCRGYGNSKILGADDSILAKAGGCGYDRFGAALGEYITAVFAEQVHKLAKRFCKTKYNNGTYKSTQFYGLFYDRAEDRAWLYGACGDSCMRDILRVIGFDLAYCGETDNGQTGTQFYHLSPISKHGREIINRIAA